MSQEILEAKSALKALVDTFSNLADEKRIPDQMLLLTPDTKVQVYMGDETSGRHLRYPTGRRDVHSLHREREALLPHERPAGRRDRR